MNPNQRTFESASWNTLYSNSDWSLQDNAGQQQLASVLMAAAHSAPCKHMQAPWQPPCKLRGNRRPFISMHTTPCSPKVDGNLAVLRERAASGGRVHFADQHVEDAQAQQVVCLGTALHTKGGAKSRRISGRGFLVSGILRMHGQSR